MIRSQSYWHIYLCVVRKFYNEARLVSTVEQTCKSTALGETIPMPESMALLCFFFVLTVINNKM